MWKDSWDILLQEMITPKDHRLILRGKQHRKNLIDVMIPAQEIDQIVEKITTEQWTSNELIDFLDEKAQSHTA